MPIAFRCACGTPLKVKDALAGKKVKCPKCGKSLAVPEAAVENADDEIVEVRDCPSCGEALASDAVICIGCGHDFRTGQKAKPKKARKPQSAEDLVESVLGYSGGTPRKKKHAQFDPMAKTWLHLRIALFVSPLVAAVVGGIGCWILNSASAAGKENSTAFAVVGTICFFATFGPSMIFLREIGELNRAIHGRSFAGPYMSKIFWLTMLMWLISGGVLFGLLTFLVP